MAEQPPAARAPGSRFGSYVVTRLLGEGGMGAVYEAVHPELGRRVAVKTMRAQVALSDAARARFLREGKAVARIRHPNVVDVYDVGLEQDDSLFMVLELLEGEDLGAILQREGVLSPQRAADLLVPIAAGLAAAHDFGIVHRDLKPDNIFVSQERGGLEPRLLDFGIAKLVEEGEDLTRTASLIGTPHYMSPEQTRSAKTIDARSDQYSLAAVLYECVTGQRAFDGDTLFSLILKIAQGELAPPRALKPDLPGELDALIVRAMARDPERRFPTIRAFGRALLPFCSARTRAVYERELASDVPDAGAGDAAPHDDAPVRTEPPEADPTRARTPARLLLMLLALAAGAAALWAALAAQPEDPEAARKPAAPAASTPAAPPALHATPEPSEPPRPVVEAPRAQPPPPPAAAQPAATKPSAPARARARSKAQEHGLAEQLPP